MSVNIVVRGLPGNVRFTKLLTSFRMLFKKAHIKQFWIRNLSDDGQFKQATVEVPSHADATKALDCLNTVPFKHNAMEVPIQAYISEESTLFYNEDEYEDWGHSGPGTKRRAKRRARSRSPGHHRQSMHTSELDMEIQLLKKQRQVIEEERLLLIEQKKLQMLKVQMESGPQGNRRQPEPMPKRSRQKSPPPKMSPKVPKPPSLPLFFQPCKKLVSQMRPIIERDASPEEVDILIKIIRAAIRKDLAIALEDKDYMKHADIINLYRERHPQEEDEAFIANILVNIRASSVYLTEGAVKDGNVTQNVANDTESQVNDKGEDAAVAAVSEPAKSQESGNPVEYSEVIQPEIDFTADVIADAVVDEVKKEKEEELLGDGEKPADWTEKQ